MLLKFLISSWSRLYSYISIQRDNIICPEVSFAQIAHTRKWHWLTAYGTEWEALRGQLRDTGIWAHCSRDPDVVFFLLFYDFSMGREEGEQRGFIHFFFLPLHPQLVFFLLLLYTSIYTFSFYNIYTLHILKWNVVIAQLQVQRCRLIAPPPPPPPIVIILVRCNIYIVSRRFDCFGVSPSLSPLHTCFNRSAHTFMH